MSTFPSPTTDTTDPTTAKATALSDPHARESDARESDSQTIPQPAIRRPSRAAVLLVGCALFVSSGAVVFFGMYDGMKVLAAWFQPPLVEFSGQVFYEGQPLSHATVSTELVPSWSLLPKIQFDGSGYTDQDGRFQLETQHQGQLQKGVYPGEYRVKIVAFHPQTSATGAPRIRTPSQYSQFTTTPLTIQVSSQANQNRQQLFLTGAPAESPEIEKELNEGQRRTLAVFLGMFDRGDHDGDGALTLEEAKSIKNLASVEEADTDGNGSIDRKEFELHVKKYALGY